jgi:DNA-binding IclR family transcriptional regulator
LIRALYTGAGAATVALGWAAEALCGACGRDMPAAAPEEEENQAAEENFGTGTSKRRIGAAEGRNRGQFKPKPR